MPPVENANAGPGTVLDTIAYMAPEQVRGQQTASRFGCVLFKMLTGQRAFRDATAADLISAIPTNVSKNLRTSGSSLRAIWLSISNRGRGGHGPP